MEPFFFLWWCLSLLGAHLRRTGRRNARRPCGTLAINTLYRLRFRITNVWVSGTIYSRLLLFRVKTDNGFGCWLKITSGFEMLQYPQVVILQLHRKGVNDTSGRKRMPPDVIVHGFWTSEHVARSRACRVQMVGSICFLLGPNELAGPRESTFQRRCGREISLLPRSG